jgi:GDSL-like Lipase/Acylhydrolase family
VTIKSLLQSSLLVLTSVLLTLALCEYGLRIYGDFSDGAILSTSGFSDAPIADRHLDAVPLPEGIDRTWFRQDPPQVARDPREVSPAAAELYETYRIRGVYASQSFYVWNKIFVENRICVKNDYVFGHYGDLAKNLKVFMPQDGKPYPRYRNPANTLTASGLRTNRYGFRGPELAPQKGSNIVRIAFLGASTTIAMHSFPFSYPEHFGYWLNLWLKANNYPLQVEVINAGREGIGSSDIAAIVEQEVLPLAPDYVIYYEGANDLYVGPDLFDSGGRFASYPSQELLPREWVQFSLVAKVIDDFYRVRIVPILAEWRRSPSKLIFPDAVNEADPDIDRNDLPGSLSSILDNLRHMSAISKGSNARFLMSSFVWLDGSEPEIMSDKTRHVEILSQVNRAFWPLSQTDTRRLVDFQNRVFQRFAASKKLDFMDIAGSFPRDPDLFTDGIHFTTEGVRMQAWVALAQFLPYFSRDLERGFVPNTQLPIIKLDAVSSTTGESYSANCSANQV